MNDGLLAVFSEPGRVQLDQFHTWYDLEHVPLRLQFPEFQNGYRFEATDGLKPGWLATYDVDLAFLGTARYESLRTSRSLHEKQVMEQLETLDRRVYSFHREAGTLQGTPRYQVVVELTSRDEEGLLEWYWDEHIPLLLQIPGWNRVRQFRLIQGSAPRILTIHDIDHPSVCETPMWREATSTMWRERAMSEVTSKSRRIFRFHNAGHHPPAGWSNPHLTKEK
jgi:hypothetical protein